MSRSFDDPSGLRLLGALLGSTTLIALVLSGSPMAILLGFVGFATVWGLTAGIMKAVFPHYAEEQRWERFTRVATIPFELHSGGGRERPSLEARSGLAAVRIVPLDQALGGYELTARVPRGVPGRIRLSLPLRADSTAPLGARHRSQDPELDDRFKVVGNDAEAAAVLSDEVRQTLLELSERIELTIMDSSIRTRLASPTRDPEPATRLVATLARLATNLFVLPEEGAKPRLIDNAMRDPIPAVRARNLRLAFEYYPSDASDWEAVRQALDDDDIECALAGAVGLSQLGDDKDREEALHRMKTIATWETLDWRVRDQAVAAMLEYYSAGEVMPFLRTMAGAQGEEVLAPSLIAALFNSDLRISPERILRNVITADDHEYLDTVLEEITKTELDFYEQFLLELAQSSDEAVSHALVRVLSEHGSIRAVEGLLTLAKGLNRSPELKQAAKEAVETIQARTHNAGGGRLSLAEASERGALSVAPGRGALSKTEDPREP